MVSIGVSADNFYIISIKSGEIELQGKYNANLVKRLSGWGVEPVNGYLQIKNTIQFDTEDASIYTIHYTITLTD